MSIGRVACVTGANKGIGYAIVRQLALQYPQSPLNNGPLTVYLTARDEARGQKALDELHNDPLLKQHKALKGDGGLTDIKFHALDISDQKSIHTFWLFLVGEHRNGIDIAINNAAVALDGFNAQVVRDTLHCNYYGTIAADQAFLPLLRPGGRLVNVSSSAGKLGRFPAVSAQRFRDAATLGDVKSILDDFEAAVDAGREEEAGFLKAAYATSKAALNAATRIIAQEQVATGKDVLINACNPGYIKTDMTKGRGIKSIDEGAETPVYLALGDIGGRTGLYWSDKNVENF